jgi:transposase InsO family protein
MSPTFPPLAGSAMFMCQWTLIQVISMPPHMLVRLLSNVITHCLAAFASMGKPQQLKTHSGPAYTSVAFQWFCEAYQIRHTTGIPYNPQGQAVVECAQGTHKMQLKRGDEMHPPAS